MKLLLLRKSGETQKPYINICERITNSTLLRSTTALAICIGTYLPDNLSDKYSATSSPTPQARTSAFDEKLADFDTDPILTCA